MDVQPERRFDHDEVDIRELHSDGVLDQHRLQTRSA